ncbi:MAG: proline--tRNA ligase [Negativicutes bacterium]
MRASKLYSPTLREVPAEAEIVSHQLLMRAGYIRKSAGGIYSYLPLALRVLKKIEAIVREEMNAEDAQEILMPITQPAEIWQASGRWDVYGDEMWRLNDRHGRPFCLGPTHEEMITTLVKMDVRSYRQLPLNLYQIQNKYRDEIRPRFGLIRGREFIMKDAYSFDKDEAGLEVNYQRMYAAYMKIFSRCGLNFRPVEADSGAIGGSGSHEFMALCETGEGGVVFCSHCSYAANDEKAELAAIVAEIEIEQGLQIVATPNVKTIEEVSGFLNLAPDKLIKSVAYFTENGPVLVLIRGDHQVNDIKLKNALGCLNLDMANERMINEDMNSVGGFLGPIGLKNVTIVADSTVMNMYNAVTGANEVDKHYINVNPKRDFKCNIVADLRLIAANDPCPRCGKPVEYARGIEVGQVFKLGTKYSHVLEAVFLDETGKSAPMVMGCYGIGISRTMAAAVEQHNDDNGIVWPVNIAPYHAVVVPISAKDVEQVALAEKIYKQLNSAGIETVLDDRNERPGVKFKDADLIGYPLKITVGAKAVNEGLLEVKERKSGEIHFISVNNYLEKIKNLLVLV